MTPILTALMFDRPEWHKAVERERRKGTAGRTAFLTRIDIDHGEHSGAFSAGFVIAESGYAECMATLEIARNGGGRFGGRVGEVGQASLLRRSVGVPTAPCTWSIGINETMKYEVEPGREEDLFALVRRGLREESDPLSK